jgi:hypothetical protein
MGWKIKFLYSPIFSLWKWSVFDISIYLSFYFKEKEKLLQEIKDKEEDLQYEKEIQEALDVKIKAIESKILRGSQNIDNSSKVPAARHRGYQVWPMLPMNFILF